MRKQVFYLATVITLSAFIEMTLAHTKMSLRDIQVLTLKQGRKTASRRTSPVPQIKCVGGDACNSQANRDLKTIQCLNRGYDGHHVQWECKADLEDTVKFGDVQVNCEGWSRPGDSYVLAGSCGVEYTLYYTAKGRKLKNEKSWGYNHVHNSWDDWNGRSHWNTDYTQNHGDWWGWLWGLISSSLFVAYQGFNRISTLFSIFAMIGVVYLIWRSCSRHNGRHSRRNSDQNNNRGYWNQQHAPPPPPPPYPNSQPSDRFWSGFTLGGLMGNAWGRSSNNYYYNTPGWSGSYWNSRPYVRTAWRTEDHGEHRRSSSNNNTSTTRTASGFGGTTVR